MASDRNSTPGGRPGQLDESSAETRRYLNAIARDRVLIAAIVLILTGGVFFVSLVLPNRYQAEATLVLEVSADPFAPTDAESTRRNLTTIESLLVSTEVLDKAANDLGGGTADSIRDKLESSTDETANIISVIAEDGDPKAASDIANAVTEAFIDVRTDAERERLESAQAALTSEIRELESQGGSDNEIGALNDRISELGVQAASAGTDLRVAEPAEVPSAPSSPRPMRNTVLAFFASLILGMLVALGRDQFRPRVSEPRELSRLINLPILASVPHVRGRFGRKMRTTTAMEVEAYETLRAQLVLVRPPTQTRVVLVTSAVHGEGKSTVTVKLGKALARAGHRTLVLSADLRWPTLHERLGVPITPGLTDLIDYVERGTVNDYLIRATAHPVDPGPDGDSNLSALGSGKASEDPASVLSGEGAQRFFEHLESLDYDYVLIDGPPILGIADIHGLASFVPDVLLVARMAVLTSDNVMDLRDLIDRLRLTPMGLVILGAKVEISPYYLTERFGFSGSPALRPPAPKTLAPEASAPGAQDDS